MQRHDVSVYAPHLYCIATLQKATKLVLIRWYGRRQWRYLATNSLLFAGLCLLLAPVEFLDYPSRAIYGPACRITGHIWPGYDVISAAAAMHLDVSDYTFLTLLGDGFFTIIIVLVYCNCRCLAFVQVLQFWRRRSGPQCFWRICRLLCMHKWCCNRSNRCNT